MEQVDAACLVRLANERKVIHAKFVSSPMAYLVVAMGGEQPFSKSLLCPSFNFNQQYYVTATGCPDPHSSVPRPILTESDSPDPLSSGNNLHMVYYVTQPHPKDAWKTVIWESRQPYSVLRHNCNDVAYDILRAYGVTELLDPVEGLVPNDWYDAQPGPSYIIDETPTIPIHLHKMSKRELALKEITLTIPPQVQGTPPPWRVNGWRAWYELNYTLDKMIRDVQTLFVSMGKLLKKRQTPG